MTLLSASQPGTTPFQTSKMVLRLAYICDFPRRGLLLLQPPYLGQRDPSGPESPPPVSDLPVPSPAKTGPPPRWYRPDLLDRLALVQLHCLDYLGCLFHIRIPTHTHFPLQTTSENTSTS